jgi:hypothetical protein
LTNLVFDVKEDLVFTKNDDGESIPITTEVKVTGWFADEFANTYTLSNPTPATITILPAGTNGGNGGGGTTGGGGGVWWGGVGGGGGGADDTPATPEPGTIRTVEINGVDVVIAPVRNRTVLLFDEDVIEALLENLKDGDDLTIDLTEDFATIKAFNLSLFAAAFEDLDLNVVFKTAFGTISIPASVLADLADEYGDTVVLTLDEGSLEFGFLTERGRTINWNDPTNPATITLPYELGDDELEDAVLAVRVTEVRNRPDMKTPIVFSVYSDGYVSFAVGRTGRYDVDYNAVNFEDAADHWAENYIAFLSARGLPEISTEANFGVETRVTRAMFAHMFAAIEGVNLNVYNEQSFTDVEPGRWFFRAIEWAADVGIINGVGDGLFAPNRLVTREEMATMLNRYIEYKGFEITEVAAAVEAENGEATEVAAANGGDFVFGDDATIAAWAKEAVYAIQELGIIQGKPGGIYDPRGDTTRAEYAAIFARLIQAFSK